MEEFIESNIIGLLIGLLILGILFFIFWIRMLVDMIKWKSEKKVLWIVLMFITGMFSILVPILYYFMIKKPRDKEIAENPIPQSTLDIERERKEQEKQRMYQ